ncbi:MAG: hypothetical protein FD174_3059 [Geobacteraceae bacterium]|nr:MAG: hypothetical protein FD174_3059 [Geobacteraceae bacterium]
MAKRKKTTNSRKIQGGKRPLVALLITIILIVLAFYLLETLQKAMEEKPVVKPGAIGRYKLPPRVEDRSAVHQPYTTLTVTPPARYPKIKRPTGPGTVAIIVDDMGSNIQEARALMGINVPITFSLIPGLPKVKEVAEAAHGKGVQVMVHMPMEPKGYPQQRMEKSGLLLGQENEEIKRRVRGYLQTIPHAVGANNHMGSQFTEDEEKMGAVFNVLKERGFFFIDSRTSPKSVGYALARAVGIETASRNVFLDNDQQVGAVKAQLGQLAGMARKRGSAIGICHPHRATIQALAAELPVLQKEGITFVYASELVR